MSASAVDLLTVADAVGLRWARGCDDWLAAECVRLVLAGELPDGGPIGARWYGDNRANAHRLACAMFAFVGRPFAVDQQALDLAAAVVSNPVEAAKIRHGLVFPPRRMVVDPRFDPQPGDTCTDPCGTIDRVLRRDGERLTTTTSEYQRVPPVTIKFWAVPFYGPDGYAYARPAA